MKQKMILIFVIAFASVGARADYCDLANIKDNIVDHAYADPSILNGLLQLSKNADLAMKDLGLKEVARRSTRDWIKLNVESCSDDGHGMISAKVNFEIDNYYFIDPVDQDSLTGGIIHIAGVLTTDAIYETAQISTEIQESFKECSLSGAELNLTSWDGKTSKRNFSDSNSAKAFLDDLNKSNLCGFEKEP